MVILKLTRNQGVALLLEDTEMEKPQVGGVKLTIFKNEDKFFQNIFMEKFYSHKTE